jgi:diacylglycerol kinase (ATP)
MPSPSKRIVVAVNPAASFGRTRDAGPQVVAALRTDGHQVIELIQESFGDLREVVAAAVGVEHDLVDALVVVGGDGMVSLGANLLAGTGIPLGIIPTGTGNDLARGLGIPLGDTAGAIEHLRAALRGEPRCIDLGLIRHGSGDTYFAGVLSAGFDALVNERANRMRWPLGASRYILAMLAELLVLRPREYEIEVDGAPARLRATLLAVANNVSLGGGMLIAPAALLDDGELDLFTLAPIGRLRFLKLFPSVFRGAHTGFSEVDIARVRRVRVACEGVVAYADGERVAALPVTVEVVPGALFVLA